MTALNLPTFLFGPSQGARSSVILERSDAPDALPDGERRLLNDLPLALAGWMSQREEDEIYGCLPLSRAASGGRVLFRAIWLREIGGEPYGLACGVYLDGAALDAIGRDTGRLAALLPVPERDNGFAAKPLALNPEHLPAPQKPLSIGLEWHDHAVLIADGTASLQVAQQLLAGVGHPPQDLRVNGWVTTARFPRIGGIDPKASFQLVVSAASLPDEGYLTGTWQDGAYVGPKSLPSPSWAAWQALQQALSGDPELANACNWAGNMIDLAPAEIAEDLLQRLLNWGDQGTTLFVRLLDRLGEVAAVADPAARLARAIESLTVDVRNKLVGDAIKSAAPVRERLGLIALLEAKPALVSDIYPAAFDILLKELGWLTWPGINGGERKAIETLNADCRFAAIEHGFSALLDDPRIFNPHVVPLKQLLKSLFNERDSLIQSDSRNHSVATLITQADKLGVNLIEDRVYPLYSNWSHYLPPDLSAGVHARMRQISTDFPRTDEKLTMLADLVSALNAAGGLQQQGHYR